MDLEAIVRSVIDDNVYMVLGTADATGRPWAAPVFYTADAYRDLYWISSPEVTHSRNLAERPEASIVIFDSRAPVGQGGERAVYLAVTATQVSPDDLERTLAEFPGFADRGGRDRGAAELLPPNAYRLYRATVTEHSVACPRPDGQPCPAHGHAYDHRITVDMAAPPA